jgi:hypothetical protein
VLKIVLRRRNLLQAFVSNQKAQQVGEYYRVNTSDVRVNVNVKQFVQYCKRVEREDRCFEAAQHGQPVSSWLHLDYEDLATPDRLNPTLAAVSRHLGIPAGLGPSGEQKAQPFSQKQDHRPVRESVLNADKVASRIARTRFAEWSKELDRDPTSGSD